MTATSACLSCREPLVGTYCHTCGQAAKTKRFDLKGVLHEIPHEIWHLDHALPHTLKALLTKPGHTIRRYLAGDRAHTYSPLSLLFMLGGLLLFVKSALHVNGNLGEATGVSHFLAKYETWVEVFSAPLTAAAPCLVLRKRTGLTYAEQLVAAVMISIGVLAIYLAFVPLLWFAKAPRAHDLVASASAVCAYAYTVWAYVQLQDDGTRPDRGARWARAIGSLAGTAVASVLFLVALEAIHYLCVVNAVLVSFAMHKVGIGASPHAVLVSTGDATIYIGTLLSR